MHAGNLSNGILEPCCIGVNDVFDELRLGLLEGYSLLGKFTLHPIKLHFLVGGPLFKLSYLGLSFIRLFLQLNHPGAKGQDLCLQLDNLLTFVEELPLGIFL